MASTNFSMRQSSCWMNKPQRYSLRGVPSPLPIATLLAMVMVMAIPMAMVAVLALPLVLPLPMPMPMALVMAMAMAIGRNDRLRYFTPVQKMYKTLAVCLQSVYIFCTDIICYNWPKLTGHFETFCYRF